MASASPAPRPGQRRRLRLGMVGGGQGSLIGPVHRAAARLDGHYELVAGCLASTPERAAASAEELGIAPERSYASFALMAERERGRDDRIDAVAIVTPNHLHFPVARAFLEAGFDVICDKPLASRLEDALALAALVERSGRVFVLTHNYTGYPLVRQARAMVADGALGPIRMIHVEYPQDWLATPLERQGVAQAEWRLDPERAGLGGCTGDIGTHAINLACFVTGLELLQVAADLTTFVPGRRLDDNVNALLRLSGEARGILWASQIAVGNANNLRLRVYGEKGGLAWSQEEPNHLEFAPLGEPPRRIPRAGPYAAAGAVRATRLPDGCPEGFFEAFATIYSDAAELIRARAEGRPPDPAARLLPSVHDGVAGMRFIQAAVASSRTGGGWVAVAPGLDGE
jgi:predicted dehydrogenase